MVGIGMLFAARPSLMPNIEDTLLGASSAGMDREDFRVLSVLTTWLDVHLARVNVDRLFRGLSSGSSQRVRLYWAVIAHWKRGDPRLKRVAGLYSGAREDLVPEGTGFLVRRHGEDSRFAHGPLRAPAGTLRDRPEDVLTPEELARRHRGYYWRVVIGATYRADMWAQLEARPELSAAELARRTYGSFATAWQARRDWALVRRQALRRLGLSSTSPPISPEAQTLAGRRPYPPVCPEPVR
jgi:hypothetical protein